MSREVSALTRIQVAYTHKLLAISSPDSLSGYQGHRGHLTYIIFTHSNKFLLTFIPFKHYKNHQPKTENIQA